MFNKDSRFSLIPFIIFMLILVFSCRKQEKIDSGSNIKLTFSTDTVFFDTVFTTIGSVTQRLMVHNNNASRIMISSIRLGGGSNSVFNLNIDGTPATSVSNVEIAAHDSLYIFVRVTVNPNNKNNPLIVTDSILFNTNGNLQKVALVAWGQDAYFYKSKKLTGSVTWDSIKPHVIYGYLRVDTNASLTISAGTKLYFHKSAYLAVSDLATLTVNGELAHPVRFLGDRLDSYYKDLPGQWDGIYLEKGSRNNKITYAIIKNGNFGVSIDSAVNSQTMLEIDNTIIENMIDDDIYAYATNVSSYNCVLGDCGAASLALDFGGSYEFDQMTIGNYWSNSVRLDSALYLSNFTIDTIGRKHYNALTQANFGNIIVYGSQDDELSFDKDNSVAFNFVFDHCLLKTLKNTTDATHYKSCIINKDPGFVDPLNFNYQIDSISPAIGKGDPSVGIQFSGINFDIKGIFRGSQPDIGAYQFVPK
jgi:hypothetical protein